MDQIFSSSKVPQILIKQNNLMIQNTCKKLLTTKFQNHGIFETLWLSLLHWNKVSVDSLRAVLKIERIEVPEIDDDLEYDE